jgi:large subunit ribosomal protein L14e
MIEVGRVCVKTAGREAGRFCVVVKQVDDSFVLITGPKGLTKVKRRRCNVDHLQAFDHKISIKSDASDAEVEQALKKGNVLQKIQEEPVQRQAPEAALDEQPIIEGQEKAEAKVPVARPGFKEAAKDVQVSESKAPRESKPEAKKGIRHKLGLHRKKEHRDKKPEHKPKPKHEKKPEHKPKPKHAKPAKKAGHKPKPKHAKPKTEKKKPAKHKAAKASKPKKGKGKKK